MKYELASSTWDELEIEAINRVIKSGRYTMGEEVAKFEREFAEFFGSKYAVMVNSGSSANLLAIAALEFRSKNNLQKGMDIIVPAVSWATTYYPVVQCGYNLKFVDIEKETLNISISEVEKAIDKNTAAIFTVNLLGQPSDLISLRDLADSRGVLLIEDNCESMGAKVNDKYAGTFGIAGTFSTFFSHHISTMEGGVIVTDDDELRDIYLSLRAHGWTRELEAVNYVHNKSGYKWDDLYRFVLPGYNLRPIEMSGAIGQEQLKKLPDFIKMRQKNHGFFKEIFSEISGIRIQEGIGESSAFGFSLILNENSRISRDELVKKLLENGVETRPIVAGNFLKQPVISRLGLNQTNKCPNADFVHSNGFFIGNHHYDIASQLEKTKDLIVSLL